MNCLAPNAIITIDVDSLDILSRFYNIELDRTIGNEYYLQITDSFLELLDKNDVKALFFVVGRDIENKVYSDCIKKIIEKGHEIGNHTYSHDYNFNNLNYAKKEEEISKCHFMLKKELNVEPTAFRAPGYCFDKDIIAIMNKFGYKMEMSLYPFALYHFMASSFKYKRRLINHSSYVKNMLGAFKYLFYFRYNPFFYPKTDCMGFPVSSIPVLNLPFNTTLVYPLGIKVFDVGLNLCSKFNIPLNFVFHWIDLIDDHVLKVSGINFPGCKYSYEDRKNMCDYMIKNISKKFNIVTTQKFYNEKT